MGKRVQGSVLQPARLVRLAWALSSVALMLAACGEARGPAPDGEPHGYLLFDPPSQEQGWKLVDDLTAHAADRERIRTSGLTGSDRGTMFVDFTGSCDAEERLVVEAKKIAGTLGIHAVRCSATAPVE
jgi:hypothetical protein